MINNDQLVVFILVLTRVSTFVAFFPLFSKKQLPSTVKLALAGSLSVFWFLQINASTDPGAMGVSDAGAITATMMIAREVIIGIVLAICLGLFFWPARVAGAYVGQELGLSLASISDPGAQDSSTLVTRLFDTFSILIFFGMNLHHFLILVIHKSFDSMFTKVGPLDLPTETLVEMLNKVSDYGLLIVGPIIIVSMMVTLVLAFLNKAAPALNLFSVGMSIRTGLGVFSLFLFCPILFGATQAYFYRVQEDIEQLLAIWI